MRCFLAAVSSVMVLSVKLLPCPAAVDGTGLLPLVTSFAKSLLFVLTEVVLSCRFRRYINTTLFFRKARWLLSPKICQLSYSRCSRTGKCISIIVDYRLPAVCALMPIVRLFAVLCNSSAAIGSRHSLGMYFCWQISTQVLFTPHIAAVALPNKGHKDNLLAAADHGEPVWARTLCAPL